MKKIPKGSCTLFGVDKTLVGGIIAATLLGGASLTAEATATNRGG